MRRAHVLFVGGGGRGGVLRTLLPAARFDVERTDRYEAGLQGLIDRNPDVCLVAYHLDGRTALDFLRESRRLGSNVPVIFQRTAARRNGNGNR